MVFTGAGSPNCTPSSRQFVPIKKLGFDGDSSREATAPAAPSTASSDLDLTRRSAWQREMSLSQNGRYIPGIIEIELHIYIIII